MIESLLDYGSTSSQDEEPARDKRPRKEIKTRKRPTDQQKYGAVKFCMEECQGNRSEACRTARFAHITKQHLGDWVKSIR